jgi:hypothetical protein
MTSFRKPERPPIEIRPVVEKVPGPLARTRFEIVESAIRAHPWRSLWGLWLCLVVAAVAFQNTAMSFFFLLPVLFMPGTLIMVWIVLQLARGAKLLKKASKK